MRRQETLASKSEQSDEELMLAVVQQRSDALAALYDRYGGLALGLATRIVSDRGQAEDVVQEAFLTVWRQAGTFQQGRGAVRTWLLSIVHHRCIDLIRKRRSSPSEPFDIVKHDLPTSDAWSDVYAHLTGTQIRAALEQLPIEQRQAIELAYFGGLTQQEIAQRLDAPLGTVKGRMRLAMQKLKGLLDDLRPVS
ncbi:MAG TPA: sigma-70 family RNA polymerase sigma factor [Chloroflexota bacterium]|jgi:RNA polymerase sigma-70 factor (ECF subfamily)|nr:sigma-70 family RNA polymerase sigma factor [Chloroflexota bacterium]